MVYTPYDFNESVRHRVEYIEERLRDGSPVAGISYDGGVLLLTLRRTQRKIFEIYDRLMFSGLGNQSDLEVIRVGAIDFAHQEGYARSPDDVTIQRVVGFAISPGIKRAFGDVLNAPFVVRALFAEMGRTPEEDLFYTLNYDGEFVSLQWAAAVAGTPEAEEQMIRQLVPVDAEGAPDLQTALRRALRAWSVGKLWVTEPHLHEEGEQALTEERLDQFLREHLQELQVEAAVLDRFTKRERKFRLLKEEEVRAALPEG
ncbi:MAG: hypothetical protein RMM06_06850 [Armatimonadota bacterium]|nr:hypothetical protein [Armatimonadota bacterium]MDW8290426.1 hypothetical protein [Armatimonadota bacterium]